MEYRNDLAFAKKMDEEDALKSFREKFHLPHKKDGKPYIYLCGNSLGLQPKSTQQALEQELQDWKTYGVEGHFHAKNPWLPYHEFLSEAMAKVVGASPEEVVVMNTLTVNLHLMMVSFYRPSGKRRKILIEADAFPSDKYGAASQIKFHGLDPTDCLIELKARPGETLLHDEDIKKVIDEQGSEIALILLGNTNYYTGQFFDMKAITSWGHKAGCVVGFDCAHGAGNVPLDLSESSCDFAVWCTYKYLNSGPGSLGGVFVNKRHHGRTDLPRFEGWWGHRKDTRFKMRDAFEPIPTVEAWQLSNPPILSMAAIWASLKLFDEAGIHNLRKKSIQLTGYLEYCVDELNSDNITIITPRDKDKRGSQLSLLINNDGKALFNYLAENGVIADWREPDVIRIAPIAMYNSYQDVYKFVELLRSGIETLKNI